MSTSSRSSSPLGLAMNRWVPWIRSVEMSPRLPLAMSHQRNYRRAGRPRVVFDPVGGPTLSKLIKALSVHGILYIYGALSDQATACSRLVSVPAWRAWWHERHSTIRLRRRAAATCCQSGASLTSLSLWA